MMPRAIRNGGVRSHRRVVRAAVATELEPDIAADDRPDLDHLGERARRALAKERRRLGGVETDPERDGEVRGSHVAGRSAERDELARVDIERLAELAWCEADSAMRGTVGR